MTVDHQSLPAPVDLPQLAVSNTFPDASHTSEAISRCLRLGVDSKSGRIRFENPFSMAELAHSHRWLTYREPEDHIDWLKQKVVDTGWHPGAKVLGVSWKDVSLLESLSPRVSSNEILFPRDYRIPGDFGLPSETVMDTYLIEALLDAGSVPRVPVDVLIARHVLEHAREPRSFLANLKRYLKAEGMLLIEVPNSMRDIKESRYSGLWEEHVSYFTPKSLRLEMEHAGWVPLDEVSLVAGGEEILVILARQGESSCASNVVVAPELKAAAGFLGNLYPAIDQVHRWTERSLKAGSPLFIVGANHVASTFIDLFLPLEVDVICIDDLFEKQGKAIGLRRVPVRPFETILDAKPAAFASAIHPGRNQSVHDRVAGLVGRDVTIASVYDLMRRK